MSHTVRLTAEQARNQSVTANGAARAVFPQLEGACFDAAFLTARRERVLAVSGLPYPAPVCRHLMNDPAFAELVEQIRGSILA